MYQAHFRLEKRPFSATPDPACFFVTEPIQEAFDELVLRAESGQGIGVLTGPAGTGKTLVCRRIAVEVSKHFTPIFLANASFPTRRALLQSILFELGRRYTRMEEQELRLAVFTSLKDLALAGRGAVLIVDEAHLMNERLLEELRMLASLSDREEPLARVILSAQLSLEERLVHPGLEALNQRVVCHRYIEPLTREESIAYVKFRIEWAGGEWAQVFSPQALARIAEAFGVPVTRLVDVPDEPAVRIIGTDQARTLWRGPSGGTGTILGATEPPWAVELWRWVLEPGEISGGDAHISGSKEMIWVESGTITLTVAGHRYQVAAGQCARFSGAEHHSYVNEGPGPAVMTMISLVPPAVA